MGNSASHHPAIQNAITHITDLLAEKGLQPTDDPSAAFTYTARDESEFSVSVEVSGSEYMLFCENWHEHYTATEDVGVTEARLRNQLLALLNGQTKLVVRYAGKQPIGFTLYFTTDGENWKAVSLTHALFFNFFSRKRTLEKVNRLLDGKVNANPFELIETDTY